MNDQLKTLLIKYQIFILPIASVLISVALLALIIVPQALKIPQTNTQIDQNRQTLAAVNQKISDLEAIDLNQYQTNLNTALTALPVDQDVPGIFNQISRYMGLDGMQISAIGISNANTVATTGNAQTLTTFKADVTTSGSVAGLESFINRLNQVPRIMQVDSLSSSAGGPTDSQAIEITLDSFYLPAPVSQQIPADKPLDKLNNQNTQTLTQLNTFNQTDLSLFPPSTASNSGTPAPPAGKADPFQ